MRKNNKVVVCVFGVIFLVAGCAKPETEVCIFGYQSKSFHCTSGDKEYSISLKDGGYLDCMPPSDIAEITKACKKGDNADITICKIRDNVDAVVPEGEEETPSNFMCVNGKGEFPLSLRAADGYYCMSKKKRTNLYGYCK